MHRYCNVFNLTPSLVWRACYLSNPLPQNPGSNSQAFLSQFSGTCSHVNNYEYNPIQPSMALFCICAPSHCAISLALTASIIPQCQITPRSVCPSSCVTFSSDVASRAASPLKNGRQLNSCLVASMTVKAFSGDSCLRISGMGA